MVSYQKGKRKLSPGSGSATNTKKKEREKSSKCHNHKPQPLPRHQEEEETDKTKQAYIEQTYEKHYLKISSLFPKRGNHNAKRTEKFKNDITQGKT